MYDTCALIFIAVRVQHYYSFCLTYTYHSRLASKFCELTISPGPDLATKILTVWCLISLRRCNQPSIYNIQQSERVVLLQQQHQYSTVQYTIIWYHIIRVPEEVMCPGRVRLKQCRTPTYYVLIIRNRRRLAQAVDFLHEKRVFSTLFSRQQWRLSNFLFSSRYCQTGLLSYSPASYYILIVRCPPLLLYI